MAVSNCNVLLSCRDKRNDILRKKTGKKTHVEMLVNALIQVITKYGCNTNPVLYCIIESFLPQEFYRGIQYYKMKSYPRVLFTGGRMKRVRAGCCNSFIALAQTRAVNNVAASVDEALICSRQPS